MANKVFEELRKQYETFVYEKYDLYEDEDFIYMKFYFTIPNLSNFEAISKIKKKSIKFSNIDNEHVKNLCFHIGMVELISYWKIACPKTIIIKAGILNEEQINWFKKLYYLGLGEYRYINHIDVDKKEFLEIIIDEKQCNVFVKKEEKKKEKRSGILIPVGGGKDSNVTLELLKTTKQDNLCIMVGAKPVSIECANIAGYEEDEIVEVIRIIDPKLIELNKKGFLNGHTPFSALLAFLTYFIADLTNKKYIALSNESSAEQSNVQGQNINHQYSKTFEFEQDFYYYSKTYLSEDITYFSFLRPINELQIAMLFSELKQYHHTFKSCNVGSKTLPWKWCANCSKCLFVYIILSTFLERQEVIDIFSNDMFEKKELLETFKELLGYGKNKPFECVGTYEEINFAITKTIKNLQNKKEKLPYLLQYFDDHYEKTDVTKDITKQYNEQNNLPKEFDEILKRRIFDGRESIS